MYCISSASEKKHEIARTSWSSCLWKLCELVSIVEEQLCVVFMYTGTPISSPMVQKCVHLKCFCFVYDVWTTDLGKNIEISSDPHSPFHCHAYIIFSLFHHFISWSVIGVFGLFLCDPWFMAHIDSLWLVKFSKMANINFRESWFGFIFINWDLWPESPPPFLKFSSLEKVF